MNDIFTERLEELINIYQFHVDTLSAYLGISQEQVWKLAKGDRSVLPENYKEQNKVINRIWFLYLTAIDDKDMKLNAFLQVLISYHHLSKETIAKIAGVTKDDVENLLSNPSGIDPEIKYKVAVTVMALRFFLKDCEPEV